MKSLENKIAIVTGAGRGIGRAIAQAYVDEGATVIVAEVNKSLGEAAVEALGGGGIRVHFKHTDMSDLSSIKECMKSVHVQFGRIDVIVNNAAVTRAIEFFDVTENDWDWMHRINAKGLFFSMQTAASVMRDQGGGRIINIASIAGKGFTGTSNIAYAASKGAVITMTRLGAHYLGEHDITVNAICPGITRTELYEEIAKGKKGEEFKLMLEATVPLRRANEPKDIAALAVFLAGDGGRNVTGQSWNVDGGLMWD